jgi:hypothetical protein
LELAVEAEELQRGLAGVELEETLEEDGIALEEMESVVAKEREAVHKKQTA